MWFFYNLCSSQGQLARGGVGPVAASLAFDPAAFRFLPVAARSLEEIGAAVGNMLCHYCYMFILIYLKFFHFC